MLKNLRSYIVIWRSGLFDKKYYLQNYPDVRKADVDPLTHFIEHGWREGRNPSQKFDTEFYLNTNPDVNKAGINPLVHYLKHSKDEERATQPGYTIMRRNFPVREMAPPHALSYAKWIHQNEPEITELIRQRNSNELFPYRPLISIIVPVFNTPEDVLRDTLDSVLNQTYTNWQLCIANGSPEAVTTTLVLKEYAEKDQRVHLVTLKKNLGIAANTNAAIALANGQYVAFLDHDDCLAPFVLFEVVSAIKAHPQTDVFYSDEDKLTADGKIRYDPHFKSAFNLELLRCMNYMCHFLVIRKIIGDHVGWLREGFEGAQDFDLILRVVEKSHWVTHIPRILYHWRAISSSTANDTNAKNHATNSGILALQDHMDRLGITAQVKQTKYPTNYRIKYSIPNNPLVSIIIPSHNHTDDLQRCVNSILKKSTYLNYEIVIFENNSHDETIFKLYEELKNTACVHVIEFNKPFNYSRINNFAVNKVSGEIILLLNNDTEVITPDWLECMLEYAIQPGVGAVGAKLYYADGTLQHGGVFIATPGEVAGHSHKRTQRDLPGYNHRLILPQNLSAVTAACLMMRKKVFNQVAGFDERFELAFGDVDLCVRLCEKGYLNVWTPYSELYHYESLTRGYEDTPEKQVRFKKEIDYFNEKWKRLQELGDPYYNPNLAIEGDFNFSLASTPRNMSARCLPIILPHTGTAQ
ncbi:MAG: glycosyltransferase family 2 protein [Pelolinea sp.]|nr:glycosyltransferase family 2 protein [Pelolinea sp.]